jgi:RNA polymerase sigma-70 factor (ECF subfamily)
MKRKTDKDYGLQTEFERIVREHKATIYTVCYMFSDDNATVADMFQEVLINIWNGLENFQGRSSAGTWIWRVSLNTCISYEKKLRRRHDTFPLEMGIDLYEENTDESGRQIRMLHDRVRRLDIFDRALILLWLEDLTYEEIGAILGISVKNVSVRLVRIKEKLKNMK